MCVVYNGVKCLFECLLMCLTLFVYKEMCMTKIPKSVGN